jgi:cytochrome c oxidase assembly protein subunit 15
VNGSAANDGAGRKVIALWLFALAAMVFVMVVLGGLTRLTHSGLSMVEWRPLTGWLPPLTEDAWQKTFAAYRQFPEYLKVNAGMTLSEFKGIFWLEFVHRLWGRLMGVAMLVPLVVFVLRGWVDRRLAGALAIVFLLGALQGAIGWYMVKSGLVDRPDVSQYRLTLHFAAALVIYGVLVWLGLTLLSGPSAAGAGGTHLKLPALALGGLVFVTALWGGFVAGLDAGFIYNTFPLMDGQLIPKDLFALTPAWLSLFEDVMTVQFAHRVLAMATLAAILAFWLAAGRAALPRCARRAVHLLGVLALLQFAAGVATLVLAVPVPLAAAHQAGAVLLWTAVLLVNFAVWRSPAVAAVADWPERAQVRNRPAAT